MEINKMLTKLGPYDQAKVEKSEAEARKAKREKSGPVDAKGDRINLSDEAKLRTEAYSTAMGAEDVRREKVEALKAKIASGEYQIDSKKIAENLVKEDLELLI